MKFEWIGFNLKAPVPFNEFREAKNEAYPLYSAARATYAGVVMLLIAAALEEELKTGLALCRQKQKISHRKINAWQAERNGKKIAFLKTGVGPRRAAASLEEALQVVACSHVLVIGYAGALDPELKLGALVAAGRALAFSLDETNHDWDHIQLDGTFELTNGEALARAAKSAGLTACSGDVLSSPYVLGDPVHKSLLYDKFHASIVDMETAALARVAALRSVPLSCIRVVSDEAADSFLAPFSYDPATRLPTRARKLAGTGMGKIYRKWKTNTAIAKRSLGEFLEGYL
jgi:adenosylhomocysteine nucleosidase